LISHGGNALVFMTLLGVLAAAGSDDRLVSGEDWPCFLGPRQDGISRETGILKKWPAAGPPKLWSRRVGNAYSAPVTSRGRLIVFHRVKDSETLDCLDARTGKPLWSYAYPTQYEDRYGYNNGPRSSPAIDGDRVYAYGAEGTLTCLDFETGRLVWQRPANREFRVPQGFFGAGTAPLVEGGLVLLNLGGPEGAGVVAFDKLTGKTAWKMSNDGASYSTPVTRTINGKRLAIFFTQAGLLALEVATGAEAYRFPFRSRMYESVNAASPVVVDDTVFLSATYGVGAVALRMEPGGPKTLWQNRTAMQNHWATSIYWQGFLFGMDGRHESGSNLRCIEFKTGTVKWAADQGLGRASFIMADGHLIALGERGDLALIEVNVDKYIEKARARVLDYPCWSPPIISHGLLYVRSENVLTCLDLRPK
jgi:outer membrane protein assembly factor BamB